LHCELFFCFYSFLYERLSMVSSILLNRIFFLYFLLSLIKPCLVDNMVSYLSEKLKKKSQTVGTEASRMGIDEPWITKSYLEMILERKGRDWDALPLI